MIPDVTVRKHESVPAKEVRVEIHRELVIGHHREAVHFPHGHTAVVAAHRRLRDLRSIDIAVRGAAAPDMVAPDILVLTESCKPLLAVGAVMGHLHRLGPIGFQVRQGNGSPAGYAVEITGFSEYRLDTK